MYEFKVSGMSCPSCAKGIRNTIATIDSKVVVNVDIEKQLVQVSSNKSIEEIAKLIEDSGYPIERAQALDGTHL